VHWRRNKKERKKEGKKVVYPSRDKINATHLSLTPKKMKVRNGKEQSRCREQV
jgi:hypothetical protein